MRVPSVCQVVLDLVIRPLFAIAVAHINAAGRAHAEMSTFFKSRGIITPERAFACRALEFSVADANILLKNPDAEQARMRFRVSPQVNVRIAVHAAFLLCAERNETAGIPRAFKSR